MNSTILALVVLAFGLTAGFALGMYFGSRPVAVWRARHAERDGEARDLDEKFKSAIRDLAGASERAGRVDDLSNALDLARTAHSDTVGILRSENAGIAAELAGLREKTANFEEQKNLLLNAQEALKKEFELAGAKVLADAQTALLKVAHERFGHSEKVSEEKLKALLAPVGHQFESLSKKVEEFDASRLKDFGSITVLMQAMRDGQDAVRSETAQLVSSLRNAPKTRGRWGEHQLRNVLDQCGLSEHTDFEMERSIETSEGRLRPDAIIRIPGDKELVIDAKVSLNAYQDAFSAESEELRKGFLQQHAKAFRVHMQTLAGRNYQAQFEKSPDYVIMFVPGEHLLTAALDSDPKLWDDAFKQRVLIATPTNLVAIARTVASVWQQKRMSENAEEISKIARLLFESISKVSADFHKMGRQLGLAVKSYNEFGRTFEGNLSSRARRLSERYIDVGSKDVTAVEFVEDEPRLLSQDAAEKI